MGELIFHPATDACETTLTKRLAKACDCPTYLANWGPCETWEEGANGRCVYCDHTLECHLTPSSPFAYPVGMRPA